MSSGVVQPVSVYNQNATGEETCEGQGRADRTQIEAVDGAPVWLHILTDVVDPLYLPAEYRVEGGLHPAALRALLRELVRASELVGFELTEFEAPSNPARRARAVEAVIRMIEPALLAGSERGKQPASLI